MASIRRMITDGMGGLVNLVTGQGTARDPIMASRFAFVRHSPGELEALFRSNWVAKKIVNIPVDDMLRQGWSWNADDDLIEKIEAEENRLQLSEVLRKTLRRDAIYGGAGIYMSINGQNMEDELVVESVRKGMLSYLTPFHSADLQPAELSKDPEKLGQPTMFRLNRGDGQQVLVHPSRVICFIGRPIDKPIASMMADDFWGDSRLADVILDIAATGTGLAGASRLMGELAISVFKVNGPVSYTHLTLPTNREV